MNYDQEVQLVARGTSQNLVGKIFGRGIHFTIQVVLARYLGPKNYGLFGFGWTLLRIIGTTATLGMENAAIYFSSIFKSKIDQKLKGLFIQVFGSATVSAAILSLILFLVSPWLADPAIGKPEFVDVVRWFTPAFIFFALLRVSTAITRISGEMKYTIIAEEVWQPVSNLLLLLFGILAGWGLGGAVVAVILSFGIALSIAFRFVYQMYPEILRVEPLYEKPTRVLLQYAIPTSFSSLFILLILWVDRLILGYLRPAADLGIYLSISQFSIIFAVILGALTSAVVPGMARMYHQQKFAELKETYTVSTKWGIYFALPLFFFLLIFPEEIIAFIYGQEYVLGALPLVILLLGQMINIFTGTVNPLLLMTGNGNFLLLLSGVVLFIDIIINWVVTGLYGIVGTAMVTSLSIAMLYLISFIRARIKLGVSPYDRRYLKGIIAGAASLIPLAILRLVEIDIMPVHSIFALLLAYGCFIGVLALLGLDQEDRDFIYNLWNAISTRTAGNKTSPDDLGY